MFARPGPSVARGEGGLSQSERPNRKFQQLLPGDMGNWTRRTAVNSKLLEVSGRACASRQNGVLASSVVRAHFVYCHAAVQASERVLLVSA